MISNSPDFQFVLGKLKASSIQDKRQQAYVLATIKRETGDTFRPVLEGNYLKENRLQKLFNYYQKNNPSAIKTIFPNGISGLTYEGRGYVQITHLYNYEKFSKELGVDLVNHPELALVPDNAWGIAEIGMTKGMFTGKKLSDYFNDTKTDYPNARRIINGLDKAQMIAGYAEEFFNYLNLPS